MEKLAITTDLEREVLQRIFIRDGSIDIPGDKIKERTHAYYTLVPSQRYDFENVLVRTNKLEARLWNSECDLRDFNFDELPLCRQFKFFALLNLNHHQRYYAADVIGMAPACEDEQNLLEFLDILSEYAKHPNVRKSVVARSTVLAKFLHDNYVTEADFKSGKQKKLPLHHFVVWGVSPEGYNHTNDLLSLFWR